MSPLAVPDWFHHTLITIDLLVFFLFFLQADLASDRLGEWRVQYCLTNAVFVTQIDVNIVALSATRKTWSVPAFDGNIYWVLAVQRSIFFFSAQRVTELKPKPSWYSSYLAQSKRYDKNPWERGCAWYWMLPNMNTHWKRLCMFCCFFCVCPSKPSWWLSTVFLYGADSKQDNRLFWNALKACLDASGFA